MTSWEPQDGWLLIEPTVLPEKTEQGIILPDSARQKGNTGTVVKAGKGAESLQGKEVVFPVNNEYQVRDSADSLQIYFAVHSDHVFLQRTPKPKPQFHRVLKGEG